MLIEGGVTGLGVGAVLGGVLAFLLRTWLVKLSKVQLERLYTPLTQSLADADALTAYCRVKVAAEFKEERKRIAARRDEELKRAEDNYRKAFAAAESPPRRKAPQDQRGLRRADGRGPDDPAARHARRHRRPRPPHGRAARPGPRPATPSSTRSTRHTRSGSAPTTRPAWNALAERWRDGMNQAAAELDAVNREVDAYCPDWNDPAWQSRSLPEARPARDPLRQDSARARLAAGRNLEPSPT